MACAMALVADVKTKPPIRARPQKAVIEYPLPGTRQTHEVVPVNDNLLIISQQDCSGLLKVRLDPVTGRPIAAKRHTIHSKYAGFHGLFASKQHEGFIWGTVQFESLILLIDPQGPDVSKEPKVLSTIKLPKDVWGPHVVIEDGDAIWTTCKGSGHLVKVTIDYQLHQNKFDVFPCGGRPIFVAVHPTSNEVYASLDMESKILRLNQSTGEKCYIDIPPESGSTPVGLVAGPDGNVWFVLLGDSSGGSGTFGCISATGEVTWFKLPVFPNAGLIHLAFDHSTDDPGCELIRIWLLASTLGSKNSVDAIFALSIEGKRVVRQDTVCMPTQGCFTHRLLLHKTGIFVTELGVSILAHATGAGIGLHDCSISEAYEVPSETSDAYGFWGLGRYSDFLHYDHEKAWGPGLASEEQLNTPKKRAHAEIAAINSCKNP